MALTLSKKAQKVKPSSTLAITAKAKALKAQGLDVVGFGAGEPDFNTPENINNAAIRAIHEGFTKYTPASGTVELKEAISRKFKEANHLEYGVDQIVVSNGGKHALTNIFQAIINPGDEVIIPAPYWLTYPEIVKLCDGVPVFIKAPKEQKYKVTVQQIRNAVTDKTKAFILNSPSNPTGMVYSKAELEEIAKLAIEKDFYVVSDEIYENLIYGDTPHVSIASLNEEIYKRTITCSGLAKSYSMTGWRIGYTGASKEITKLMSSLQSHQTSNPNSIAQKAAVEALNGPQETVFEMRAEFAKRREYMYERLCNMPFVSCIEPEGAFYVFLDCAEVLGKTYQGILVDSITKMAEILIEQLHVAVVPCADFGFADHVRLSYAISIASIKKGLDRLEEFLKELEG